MFARPLPTEVAQALAVRTVFVHVGVVNGTVATLLDHSIRLGRHGGVWRQRDDRIGGGADVERDAKRAQWQAQDFTPERFKDGVSQAQVVGPGVTRHSLQLDAPAGRGDSRPLEIVAVVLLGPLTGAGQ